MRPYHLVSGITGLLGEYLLRDLAEHGVPLAVLVRPARGSTSARQRVEDLCVRWERRLRRAMPRPVVLESDLTKPNLGLSPDDVRWVARHCDAMIHNAASLQFVAKESSGEPYRSNVEGTRNVLALCREAGITRFHHVSTAYVCGLRTGRILETELDVGQESANDYERSKVQSEKLVRESAELTSVTVFRPGIIVGDATTGYTSTFQGYYQPLQAACSLRALLPSGVTLGRGDVLGAFGLKGSETKNLVPVDWVSAVMGRVIANESLHGATYHLTPREATPAETIADSMRDAFDLACEAPASAPAAPDDMPSFLEGISKQTEVYRAYWRDDPRFDDTNTRQAAPDLPCPAVDEAMLKRTAAYAVRAGFGWPKPAPCPPPRDLETTFAERLPRGDAPSSDQTAAPSTTELGLSVTGPGGGEWTVTFSGSDASPYGTPVAYRPGLCEDAPTACLNDRTLDALLSGPDEGESIDGATLEGVLVWRDTPRDEAVAAAQRLAALLETWKQPPAPDSAGPHGTESHAPSPRDAATVSPPAAARHAVAPAG